MIKKILAVITAAVCAGAITEFIPESAPAVAAGVSAAAQSHATSISDRVGTICSQAWPYYEPACWHDDRGSAGTIRVVRVIVSDRSVTGRTSQARP